MTLKFAQPFAGGRIVAISGSVDVGAIFPPSTRNKKSTWTWRLWLNGRTLATEGHAPSELSAKNALLGAWIGFLHRAGLKGGEA